MRRKKKPSNIPTEKKKIKKIVESLSSGWNSDERETSILFDYTEKRVHLETSYPATARRWFKNLWGDPKVRFDDKAATLKVSVPWEYCRKADLIIKSKYRQFED